MVYCCRICKHEEKDTSQLIAPCDCDTPLLRWAHPVCLLNVTPTSCPVCQFSYQQRPSLPFGLSDRFPLFMTVGIVVLFFRFLGSSLLRGTFWTKPNVQLRGPSLLVFCLHLGLVCFLYSGRVIMCIIADYADDDLAKEGQSWINPLFHPLLFMRHQLDAVAMMFFTLLWHFGFLVLCVNWRLNFFYGAALYVPAMLVSYLYCCLLAWQGRLTLTILSFGYIDGWYWFPPVDLSAGGRFANVNFFLVILVLLLHCVFIPLFLCFVNDFWVWLCGLYPPRAASRSSFHFLFAKLVAWMRDAYTRALEMK